MNLVYVLTDGLCPKRAIKLLDSYLIKYNYYLISSDEYFIQIKDRSSINILPLIF